MLPLRVRRKRSLRVEKLEDRLFLHGGVHNGDWLGVTETGGTLSFHAEGQIVSSASRPFMINTPGGGSTTRLTNSKFPGLVTAGNNDAFDFSQGAQGGNPSYAVQGTLHGGEWAEGTIRIFISNQLRHTERWTARLPTSSATISIDQSSRSIAEDGGQSRFTATADFPWALPRTIDLVFSGSATQGVDYTLSPSQDVVIPAFELDGQTRLTAVNDSLEEGNSETVNISIAGVSNGEVFAPTMLPAISIDDDDDPLIPEISVSPISHAFGAIAVTGGSATTTFTIANVGTATLSLTGSSPATVSGRNAADFTVIQQPPASVAPAGQVTFEVGFDPQAVGLRQASIVVASNDGDENPVTIQLTGTGLPTPGDYNGSGTIDAADYVVWRKTHTATVPPFSGADGSGNGQVDQADYDIWRANYGRAVPTGSAASVVQRSSSTTSWPAEAESSGTRSAAVVANSVDRSPVTEVVSNQPTKSRLGSNRPVRRDAFIGDTSRDQAVLALLLNKSTSALRGFRIASVIDSLTETNLRNDSPQSAATLDAAFATL